MSEWQPTTLSSCVKINTSSIDQSYRHETIIYLDTGSITCNRIESLQEFKLSEAPSRAKRLVKNQDVIYSSVRPNQLHYGFITNPLPNLVVSTGFVVLESLKDRIEPKYLYYYLTQRETTEYLHSIAEASTSAYPSLKPSDIEALDILLPPLPEQRAIAAVLSSFDDKIDLLHRQNKILEAMAETLFRQWFVDPCKDGLPEGWEEAEISSIVEIQSGFAFKSETFNETGQYKLVTIKAVQDGYLDLNNADGISEIPSRMPNYCHLKEKDILLSLTGNVGRCCIVDKINLLLNQRVAKIHPKLEKDRAFSYFFFRLRDTRQQLEEIAKGTAQANLSPIETGNIIIAIPSRTVMDNFSQISTPLFEKLMQNKKSIHTLDELRDTLLPKLMSGEVRVKI